MKQYEIQINGATYVISVDKLTASSAQVTVNGESKTVQFKELLEKSQPVKPTFSDAPAEQAPAVTAPAAAAATAKVGGTAIPAPMPGKIRAIKVKMGDSIKPGDIVCTLEAMKMEMPISATAAGTVLAVHVTVGDNVAFNDALVTIG